MSSPRPRLTPLLVCGVLALSLSVLISLVRPAEAQSSDWTPPRLVFEAQGQVDWPTLIADEYGAVHGLWTYSTEQSSNSPNQVYYVRLDRPNWQPIDIITYRGARSGMTALNWAKGLLVTWTGSQYSQADLAPEVSARAWRGPYNLSTAFAQPGLAQAPDGSLWMAFGSQADKGIYVQRLDPDTDAWSTPSLVTFAVTPNTAPDWVRPAFAEDGTLHVTWAEYQLPEGFPPIGVFYARSGDAGATWTTPRQAAPRGANQPSISTGPDQRVYLSWVGMAGVGGKYVQVSSDGGATWSDDYVLFPPPDGGSQGSIKIAVDSAGTPHAVFTYSGCIWHLWLEGETWSAGECLTETLAPGQLKEFPAMAIGLGNQLHVLFWTDRQQIWYMTRQLDAPAVEPKVLPTALPVTPTAVVPTDTPVPTATHLPDLGPAPAPGAVSQSATLSIVAGVLPVMLFFLIVGLVRVRGRK